MSSAEFDNPESRSPEPGDPDSRGSRRAGMGRRGRTLAVSVGALAIAAAVAIVGFGSLAGANDTSGTPALPSSTAATPSFPQLSTDQKACLKNALGDLIPAAGSTPTMPTPDQIKNGISRLKDAMATCGVTLPAGGVPGGAGSFPGLTTDQKTCLKNALGDLMPAAGSALTVPTPDQIKNGISKLKDAMATCGVTLPGAGSGQI